MKNVYKGPGPGCGVEQDGCRRSRACLFSSVAVVAAVLLWGLQLLLMLRHLDEIGTGLCDLYAADDFAHYYCGARRALSGDSVYCRDIASGEVDILATAAIRRPTNPPGLTLLTTPLALLSQTAAWITWNVFSFSVFAISIAFLLKDIGVCQQLRHMTLAALPFWGPLLVELRCGQVQLLLSAGVTASFLLFRREKKAIAGAVFGAVVAVKFLPMGLFTFFVGRRAWRFLFSAGITFVLALLLTQLHSGVDFRDYWNCATPTIGSWAAESTFNQSLAAVLRNFGVAVLSPDLFGMDGRAELYGVLAIVVGVLAMGLGLACGAMSRRGSIEMLDICFAGALFVSVVMAPLAWTHYYVLVLASVVTLAGYLPPREYLRKGGLLLFCFPFAPWYLLTAAAESSSIYRLAGALLTFLPGMLGVAGFACLWWGVKKAYDGDCPSGPIL